MEDSYNMLSLNTTRNIMRCLLIPSFPNYEVSDCGRVFSLNYNGTGKRKEMAQLKNKADGRLCCCMRSNGKTFNKKVHQLVLEAFVGPRPAGMVACHNDGNHLNNNLSNLRWDTKKANQGDSIQHATFAQGSKQGSSKITETDAMQIRALYETGSCTLQQLANQFGLTKQTVWSLVKGKTWKHIL
jgi:hypothetical protein